MRPPRNFVKGSPWARFALVGLSSFLGICCLHSRPGRKALKASEFKGHGFSPGRLDSFKPFGRFRGLSALASAQAPPPLNLFGGLPRGMSLSSEGPRFSWGGGGGGGGGVLSIKASATLQYTVNRYACGENMKILDFACRAPECMMSMCVLANEDRVYS